MTAAIWRKKIRRIVTALLAVSLSLSLAGCGAKSNEIEIEQNQGSRKISVSWWGNDPRHQYTLKGLEIFQDENPDIYVSHSYGVWNGYERRYQIMMLSHQETDVMQVNYAWLYRYSPNGDNYYDLKELSDSIDLSNFTEEDLETGTVNGHLIALPIAYNTPTLFYNKDIYDSYGLELPKTWEDLENAAKVMSKDGIYPVGMISKHLFLLMNARFEQLTGRTLFAEDGSYQGSADDLKLILEQYKQLIDEKVFQPVNEFDSSTFQKGTTAGIACWASEATRNCQALVDDGANVELGDYLRTEGKSGLGWYMKPATMYTISKNTKDPEAAGKLLNFLVNDPEMAVLQGTEKGVPVSKSALQALQKEGMLDGLDYKASQMIHDSQDELKMMIPIMEDTDIQEAFTDCSNKYIYGKEDLDTAAQEMDESFRTITAG
ncbi:MAG: ABC transporter substrate-binding protein [Eubacterium sp.]|nr:ABC transporter substrate-binding protein [Eubacterium sp.]